MQNLRIKLAALLIPLAVMISACAAVDVPKNWLDEPDDFARNSFGGWIEIVMNTEKENKFSGELLAVSGDSVFIVNDSFQSFAWSGIKEAKLTAYDANVGNMTPLVVLGALSTISNGFYLVFTLPMWTIGGLIAVPARSTDPIINYPEKNYAGFAPYCRFPQGLPESVIRKNLRIKPVRPQM